MLSSPPHDRRGFLRSLVSLPLIGGAVTLIGQPTAVAEPVTPDLLEAYRTWLLFERRLVAWEMAANPEVIARYGFSPDTPHVLRFDQIEKVAYFFGDQREFLPQPERPLLASSRAAVVLSAAGCDWRTRL